MRRLFFVGVLAVARPAAATVEDGIALESVPREDGETLEEPERTDFSAVDTRWRMRNTGLRPGPLWDAPASLRDGAYVYTRARFRAGPVRAGWMARRASDGPPLTLRDLDRRAVLKYAAEGPGAGGLERWVAGNYALCYGQGLVFYDGLGEFVRPLKVRGNGAAPDFSASRNDYLKGAWTRFSGSVFQADLFLSRKDLDPKLDAAGRAPGDIAKLRSFIDGEGRPNSLREVLAGGRMSFSAFGRLSAGLTVARARYSRPFDAPVSSFSYAHVFRGDDHLIAGADLDMAAGDFQLFGEAAWSRSSGGGVAAQEGIGWTFTPLWRAGPLAFWTSFFDYGSHFFTRHGKGVAFAVAGEPESLSDNQRGVSLGWSAKADRHAVQAEYVLAAFPLAVGDGKNRGPIRSSQARQIRLQDVYTARDRVEVLLRYHRTDQERYDQIRGGTRRQERETVHRLRLQAGWPLAPRAFLRLRRELRLEESPFQASRERGSYWMAEVRLEPASGFSLRSRVYFFRSPRAYLTTGVEEVWNDVVHYSLAGGQASLRGSPGTRVAVILEQKVGTGGSLWLKYDGNDRPAEPGGDRHGLHLQADWRWGKM